MDKRVCEAYKRIITNELKTALGCTEPIAVAYAASKAAEVLCCKPERCVVSCSGNIIKNVMGVTVPMSNGMKGLAAAATLGAVGGNPHLKLDVLRDVSSKHVEETRKMISNGFCKCKLIEECKDNLHIVVELYGNGHSSLVEIIGKHTNITRIEKDGECLEGNSFNTTSPGNSDDIELLNVKDILTFADTADLEDIRDTLERQLCLNSAISQEGMIGDFGANVGSTLLAKNARNVPSLRERAKASAASGSDARMSGCPLPVVINSGSGNQGITVTMPVLIYAEAYEIDHDRMLRALIISNLISIHQKRFIGDLSAYCGASSAACGAGAAIAWMLSNDSETKVYELVSNTITNTIATIGGMVCDGAKPSCAAKISVAVDAAITAWELSVKNLCFKPGEGLVKSDVEKTIRSIGRVAKNGMKATDTEIINIMLDE